MKRSIIFAVVGLCATALVVLFMAYRHCAYTSPSKSYATLAAANQAITNGWLPEFLPASAKEIRAKYDYEANRVLAVFSFDSPDHVKEMLLLAEELPNENLNSVRPSLICRREPWFPNWILDEELGNSVKTGFRLYRIPDNNSHRKRTRGNFQSYWFLLMDREAGICYLWLN
jgi:hypothetical protein